MMWELKIEYKCLIYYHLPQHLRFIDGMTGIFQSVCHAPMQSIFSCNRRVGGSSCSCQAVFRQSYRCSILNVDAKEETCGMKWVNQVAADKCSHLETAQYQISIRCLTWSELIGGIYSLWALLHVACSCLLHSHKWHDYIELVCNLHRWGKLAWQATLDNRSSTAMGTKPGYLSTKIITMALLYSYCPS